jgi:post-segregation antitoxin (ccd killing protein)
MARLNVYLPDEVAADLRAVGLNLSMVTRVAVLRELARYRTQGWLQRVAHERAAAAAVTHEAAFGALRAAEPER